MLAASCRLSRAQHRSEKVGEGPSFFAAETGKQRRFILGVFGYGPSHQPAATVHQMNRYTPAIVRVRVALDQASVLQAVQPLCHAGGGQHESTKQLGGRECVRRWRNAQSAQHPNITAGQPIASEDFVLALSNPSRDPRDPTGDVVGVDRQAGLQR